MTAPSSHLAFDIVKRSGSATAAHRSLYLLHGIYGRGRNWAGIARALTTTRPEWTAVLVDLRGHGESPLPPPPHTVASAAQDVIGLSQALELPSTVVLGHSFGGKVALAIGAGGVQGLEQIWLVDSTPAPRARDGSAWQVLEAARAHPGPFASRQELSSLLEADGIAPAVASWMGSNVVRDESTLRWRLDFDVMESLLNDFAEQDYWTVIESPPGGVTIHIVKAEESHMLDEQACARIEEAARKTGRVRLHRVAGGHWVNTDSPEALIALLARELPGA